MCQELGRELQEKLTQDLQCSPVNTFTFSIMKKIIIIISVPCSALHIAFFGFLVVAH